MLPVVWLPASLPYDASALESSISTLEKEIATLESSSSRWEILLTVFSVFVLLGVAIEITVVLKQYLDDRLAWQLATIRLPTKPSAIKLMVEILRIAHVSLGIAGEIGIGLWIAHQNGILRTKNA